MFIKDFIQRNKTFILGYLFGLIIICSVYIISYIETNEFNPFYFILLIGTITFVLFLIPLSSYLSSPNKDYINPSKNEWGELLQKAYSDYFYENGFCGEFSYHSRRLFKIEFKKYRDIKFVCLFNFNYSRKTMKKGIHIETKDNKLINIFIDKIGTQDSEIYPILKLLKKKCGSEWNNIFDKDYVITDGLKCYLYLANKEKVLNEQIGDIKKDSKYDEIIKFNKVGYFLLFSSIIALVIVIIHSIGQTIFEYHNSIFDYFVLFLIFYFLFAFFLSMHHTGEYSFIVIAPLKREELVEIFNSILCETLLIQEIEEGDRMSWHCEKCIYESKNYVLHLIDFFTPSHTNPLKNNRYNTDRYEFHIYAKDKNNRKKAKILGKQIKKDLQKKGFKFIPIP